MMTSLPDWKAPMADIGLTPFSTIENCAYNVEGVEDRQKMYVEQGQNNMVGLSTSDVISSLECHLAVKIDVPPYLNDRENAYHFRTVHARQEMCLAHC
jgi:hypothetical protein